MTVVIAFQLPIIIIMATLIVASIVEIVIDQISE
jgi:hypothetical protein